MSCIENQNQKYSDDLKRFLCSCRVKKQAESYKMSCDCLIDRVLFTKLFFTCFPEDRGLVRNGFPGVNRKSSRDESFHFKPVVIAK